MLQEDVVGVSIAITNSTVVAQSSTDGFVALTAIYILPGVADGDAIPAGSDLLNFQMGRQEIFLVSPSRCPDGPCFGPLSDQHRPPLPSRCSLNL